MYSFVISTSSIAILIASGSRRRVGNGERIWSSGTSRYTISLTDGSDNACLYCLHVYSDVRCACSNCKKNYLGCDTVKAKTKRRRELVDAKPQDEADCVARLQGN